MRLMNQTSVLGATSVFRGIVGQMQHDLFMSPRGGPAHP
jgi:UTP:GlnB (protein PII) uridylyltransferase